MCLLYPCAFSCRNWGLIFAASSKTWDMRHDSPFSWWQWWHISCTWHLITKSTGHHCARMLMTFSTCHSSVSVTHEFLLHSSTLRQPVQHEKHQNKPVITATQSTLVCSTATDRDDENADCNFWETDIHWHKHKV